MYSQKVSCIHHIYLKDLFIFSTLNFFKGVFGIKCNFFKGVFGIKCNFFKGLFDVNCIFLETFVFCSGLDKILTCLPVQ